MAALGSQEKCLSEGIKKQGPKKMAYGIIQTWTKIPEVNGYFELSKYLCIAI